MGVQHKKILVTIPLITNFKEFYIHISEHTPRVQSSARLPVSTVTPGFVVGRVNQIWGEVLTAVGCCLG